MVSVSTFLGHAHEYCRDKPDQSADLDSHTNGWLGNLLSGSVALISLATILLFVLN